MVIGGSAILVFLIVWLFMENPEGQMAEVMPDGTVQMFDVT